jgi:Uma2 family endonuclease
MGGIEYKSIEIFVLKDEHYQIHSFGVDDEKISSAVLEGFEIDLGPVFSK